jgi:hypothetical protein
MDHLKSWNDFFLELHANDNAIRFKHCFWSSESLTCLTIESSPVQKPPWFF